MAEFCLECWNKLHNTEYTEDDVVISKCLYICEECEQYTWVVIRVRETEELYWSAIFTWPLDLICVIITAIKRGVRKLWHRYKERKNNNQNSTNR